MFIQESQIRIFTNLVLLQMQSPFLKFILNDDKLKIFKTKTILT